MDIIGSVVHGEVRLWKVYWFGHFCPSILLAILVYYLSEVGDAMPDWALWSLQTFILCYAVWITVGVWNCAPNVKHRFFYWAGRAIAVLGFLNVLVALLGVF